MSHSDASSRLGGFTFQHELTVSVAHAMPPGQLFATSCNYHAVQLQHTLGGNYTRRASSNPMSYLAVACFCCYHPLSSLRIAKAISDIKDSFTDLSTLQVMVCSLCVCGVSRYEVPSSLPKFREAHLVFVMFFHVFSTCLWPHVA